MEESGWFCLRVVVSWPGAVDECLFTVFELECPRFGGGGGGGGTDDRLVEHSDELIIVELSSTFVD